MNGMRLSFPEMRFPVLLSALLLLASVRAAGQEVLPAAKVRARAARKHLPALGLPVRKDGGDDPVIYAREGKWFGAESMRAAPHWGMWTESGADGDSPVLPASVWEICRSWAEEKPAGPVYIVTGPLQGMRFFALCAKTRSSLGWKSICFVLPEEGPEQGKDLYACSHSINWLEHRTGYDFFPRLPAHLQEIIEEMTASELLCPLQEFDPGMDEGPDREIDYDWEEDQREMG